MCKCLAGQAVCCCCSCAWNILLSVICIVVVIAVIVGVGVYFGVYHETTKSEEFTKLVENARDSVQDQFDKLKN